LRTLLLDKLSVYGLSAGCVNQFWSYLASR
jgi:hypothetical protein